MYVNPGKGMTGEGGNSDELVRGEMINKEENSSSDALCVFK